MKAVIEKIRAFIGCLFTDIKWLCLKLIQGIKWLWKKYPELFSIPMALAVWVLSVRVLRWIDPTSGIFDAGVFQIPIFSVLQLFVYVSIAWLIMGLVFGTYRKYLVNDLKEDFKKLSPWQKIRMSYTIFLSLLLSLVALSYTLG